MVKIILNNLYEEELEKFIEKLGLKRFRADQIFRALHNRNIKNIDNLKQLPKKDREILKKSSEIRNLEILKVFNSKLDETKKFLYKLDDGYLIEGVLMKYKHGYSLCVSTQVGCRMGCSFCASTKDGMDRNLEPSEIVSQLYEVEEKFNIRISNVVLMGSGEPLDNYKNVIKALRLWNSDKGRNFSFNRVTLSTCGVADKIIDLGKENIPINLAISIHSFDNEIRSKIMPINHRFDIDTLMNSVREYEKMTNDRVSFEYTVIPGENDRNKDIELIKEYTKDLNYIINLIALNPINEYNKSNSKLAANVFKNKLENNNINVTLRRELGSDISASCGQLKKHYLKEGEVK